MPLVLNGRQTIAQKPPASKSSHDGLRGRRLRRMYRTLQWCSVRTGRPCLQWCSVRTGPRVYSGVQCALVARVHLNTRELDVCFVKMEFLCFCLPYSAYSISKATRNKMPVFVSSGTVDVFHPNILVFLCLDKCFCRRTYTFCSYLISSCQ